MAMDPNTKPCAKCSKWQDEKEFIGANGQPTRYCATCRERARESMKTYHKRKRLGIAVTRGRPRQDPLEDAVRIMVTVPRAHVADIEAYAARLVEDWVRQHSDHPQSAPLPPGFVFGESLSTPPTTKPSEAPQSTTRSSKKGARSAEDQLFLDHCEPSVAAFLSTAEPILMDMRKREWERAGKPNNWVPPKRKRKGHGPSGDTATANGDDAAQTDQ